MAAPTSWKVESGRRYCVGMISVIGTFPTWPTQPTMSVLGGKADSQPTSRNTTRLTQNGHGRAQPVTSQSVLFYRRLYALS
jgi:hypothetical protein